MDETLIVQIFVRDDTCQHGRVSTAYPVTRELVLTARHALTPGGEAIETIDADRVTMRWFNIPDQRRKWQSIHQEDVVWDDVALDLALVRFALPLNKQLQVTLSDEKPLSHWKWHTIGFPNFGPRNEADHNPSTIKGQILQPATTNGRFELTTDLGPHTDPYQWGGTSGAPVFVGDQIIGVILEVRPRGKDRLKDDQLISIALHHVFTTKGEFRRHVRPSDPEGQFCETLEREVTILLTVADDLILVKLRKKLPLADSLRENASAAARWLLLAHPFEPIKTALEELYQQLEIEKKGATDSNNILDSLWELYVIVMTFRFHPEGVNGIIQQQQSNPSALLRAQALTYAAVELIMACRDNRTAALVIREVADKDDDGKATTRQDIRSEFQLPMPPETGRAPEDWLKAFLKDLHALFGLPSEYRRNMSSRALADEAKDELRDLMKSDARTRYVVFVPRSDDDQVRQNDIEHLAGLIKSNFSGSDRPLVEAILVKSERDQDFEKTRAKERELRFLRKTLESRTRQKIA